MSYNPNGPRNTMGSGTLGTSTTPSHGTGTSAYEGTSRTIPVAGQDSVEETAEGLRAKAEHLASAVKDKASQLGSTVSDKAGAAVTSVGEQMSHLAGTLRDKAPTSLAPYAEKAADGLEAAGTYLQDSTMTEFFDDVTGIIRRHPMPAMLTGVAIGFLLARNSRR